MMKVFDSFTVKRRYFIVRKENMLEVLEMIQTALSEGYFTGYMSLGNCGWANEPDAWFVHVNLTQRKWRTLLMECKKNKYQLIVKDVPDRMYFTKIEGSK